MNVSILILDFGSQYTQLIARKVRELRFYAEIIPYHTPLDEIKKIAPEGIILSGGPHSVYDKDAPLVDAKIFTLGVPVLGICYGLQLMAFSKKGKVEASVQREYGPAHLKTIKDNPLLNGIKPESRVWMSHGDKVTRLPRDFETLAVTESSEHAVIGHKNKPWYGVQFHPEVQHTREGKKILANFCQNICGIQPGWTMKNFAKEKIKEIKAVVKDQRVLLGLSGGVDSMVTARLIHEAIGDQLTCVYVDNGLMRAGETEQVEKRFASVFGIPLQTVKAGPIFLKALKNVTDPEKKRKIIGKLFVDEFNKRAKKMGHHEFLAQGTLYTDVIESVSVKGPSQTIKSHHNRVEEILKLLETGKVIEPLKELFKDEVRRLGLTLKMPREILFRHPFPGPGLAIRIMGEVTAERLNVLRKADTILIEELKNTDTYRKVWQAFAVFLPVQSVGVMGDKRTYENVIALRMVESKDGMTADFARIPHRLLSRMSNRIINEVPGVNRVVYDISSKPPSTIEWE